MISTPHATSNGSTEGSTTTNNDSNNNNVPEILRGLMSQLGDFVCEIQEEYAPVKQVSDFVSGHGAWWRSGWNIGLSFERTLHNKNGYSVDIRVGFNSVNVFVIDYLIYL